MTAIDWKLKQMIKASGWPLAPECLYPDRDFNAPVAPGDLVPLHWVCAHGKDGLLAYMLSQGADPLGTSADGQDMLTLALQSGSFQTMMRLIDHFKAQGQALPSPERQAEWLSRFAHGHPNQKNRLQQTLRDWARRQKMTHGQKTPPPC